MDQKKTDRVSGYKTEDQLKEEAKRKRAEQARIDALKAPVSARRKKTENFWYHYKWHVIAGAAGLFFIVFFLQDVVFRVRPDITILLLTESNISSDTLQSLETVLQSAILAPDNNSETVIQIEPMTVSLDPISGQSQMDYALTVKLTAVIAANAHPLYLLDDTAYRYIAEQAGMEYGDSIFVPLAFIPAAKEDRLPLSNTVLTEIPGLENLGELTFCLRLPPDSSNKSMAHYNFCKQILQSITR